MRSWCVLYGEFNLSFYATKNCKINFSDNICRLYQTSDEAVPSWCFVRSPTCKDVTTDESEAFVEWQWWKKTELLGRKTHQSAILYTTNLTRTALESSPGLLSYNICKQLRQNFVSKPSDPSPIFPPPKKVSPGPWIYIFLFLTE